MSIFYFNFKWDLSILYALLLGLTDAYNLACPHCSALLTCGLTDDGFVLYAPIPLLYMVCNPLFLYPVNLLIDAMVCGVSNGSLYFLLNFCLYVRVIYSNIR